MFTILFLVYLYSEQYLNYSGHEESKVPFHSSQLHKYSSSSVITDIPLTERQSLRENHLSTSMRFLSLPLRIVPNDTGLPFFVASKTLCICPYLVSTQVLKPVCSSLRNSTSTLVTDFCLNFTKRQTLRDDCLYQYPQGLLAYHWWSLVVERHERRLPGSACS